MQISAALVKELRERTGAGMMDCKKSLQATEGDIDAAIEAMRKSGAAKAAKKAGRIAAEGVIKVLQNDEKVVILEVNCETDFVAKDNHFLAFVDAVINVIASESPRDVAALFNLHAGEQTVEVALQQLIAKIGENITIRRFASLPIEASVAAYLHGNRIGVIVELDGGDESLAKDIAMHIAAMKPLYISEAEISKEALAKEKEIILAQIEADAEASDQRKPADIIEKMVNGRLKKYLQEITLLGQQFVKEPDQKVETLLQSAQAKVISFLRYEVGEGIEKQVDNFVEEVMAQAKGAK